MSEINVTPESTGIARDQIIDVTDSADYTGTVNLSLSERATNQNLGSRGLVQNPLGYLFKLSMIFLMSM